MTVQTPIPSPFEQVGRAPRHGRRWRQRPEPATLTLIGAALLASERAGRRRPAKARVEPSGRTNTRFQGSSRAGSRAGSIVGSMRRAFQKKISWAPAWSPFARGSPRDPTARSGRRVAAQRGAIVRPLPLLPSEPEIDIAARISAAASPARTRNASWQSRRP